MKAGERIRQRRKEIGMSQTELAEKVGTTKQNIYKYENGIITNIPSDKIEAIAKALTVPPSSLMGWNDNAAAISHSTSKVDMRSATAPCVEMQYTSEEQDHIK